MIHEVNGDILLTKAEAIVHGVAPNDDFHQGLALELRKRYPSMYSDFRHYCHVHSPKEGGLWTWSGVGHARIVNLLTQEAPRNKNDHPGPAKMKHVNHALHALKKEVEERSLKSLAITRIATGVGGLDWDEVKPLLEDVLGGLDIPIYVYAEYHAGMQADEPTV